MHDDNPENRRRLARTGQVGGKPGVLYQTAVSCFVLAMPNRYLPILQEGKIDSLRRSNVSTDQFTREY